MRYHITHFQAASGDPAIAMSHKAKIIYCWGCILGKGRLASSWCPSVTKHCGAWWTLLLFKYFGIHAGFHQRVSPGKQGFAKKLSPPSAVAFCSCVHIKQIHEWCHTCLFLKLWYVASLLTGHCCFLEDLYWFFCKTKEGLWLYLWTSRMLCPAHRHPLVGAVCLRALLTLECIFWPNLD